MALGAERKAAGSREEGGRGGGSASGKHACAVTPLRAAWAPRRLLTGCGNKNCAAVSKGRQGEITSGGEPVPGYSRFYLTATPGESSPRKEMR